jgi:5-methylthioadenosine/S-adenosylhomocysteine deaminase
VVGSGAVLVRDDRIAAVAPRNELTAAHPGVPVHDLGASILAPGFVDAHCHLEWALTAGLAPGGEFGRWLGAFLAAVAGAAPDFAAAAADAGAVAALRAGSTTLCDSGPSGAGAAAMTRLGLRGASCVEAFGSGEGDSLAPALERIRAGYARAVAAAGPRVHVGISPHAPYSVGPALWSALQDDPDLSTLLWSTHFAESPAELVAIDGGGGTIAHALDARGARPARWPGAAGDGVITRLARAGALAPGTVAAHCVQLDAAEPVLLGDAGVAVAHCPVSNAYLGCGVAPLRALRDAGVRVGLGTDGPASAGNYDIRAEARACALMQAAHGVALTPSELVRLATQGGAQALGMDDRIGTLEPGKCADIVALVPAPHVLGADPHVAVLDPETRVTHVWVHGMPRVANGEVVGTDIAVIARRAAVARASVC